MMFWEGYKHIYLYDKDGDIKGESNSIFVKKFTTFKEAMEWFKELIDHHDNLAKWYVKVFDSDHSDGDILCAFSMEWDDSIFNNDAV